MSKTWLHKEKSKFKPGDKMSLKFKKHSDRNNKDKGEERFERNKLKYKFKKEDYENIS